MLETPVPRLWLELHAFVQQPRLCAAEVAYAL
jgi:hypothetical protein